MEQLLKGRVCSGLVMEDLPQVCGSLRQVRLVRVSILLVWSVRIGCLHAQPDQKLFRQLPALKRCKAGSRKWKISFAHAQFFV